jgi:hypothetical protein
MIVNRPIFHHHGQEASRSPKNPPDDTVKVGALAYIGQTSYLRGCEILRAHLESIMDITITIIMPTKALQKLGRLPAPGPKIKKDPKSKPKPKLKITASSRITRQTNLSRSNLPPPEAPSQTQEKKGRARAASSPLTSPIPSSSDSPRWDGIVEMRVAGSEVAELIARCEREETEIDRLLIEIESQCSDE